MTTATMLSTICVAGELRTGDQIVNPTWNHNGVYLIADVLECTDVDTDEESIILVLDNAGSVILPYGDLVRIVVG